MGERTKQRIDELIPDGVLDDRTRLALVNAVYLKADWQVPFAKASTKPAPFHVPGGDVSTPFMAGAERWGWAEGDGWQAVELPYVDGKLVMTILVPATGRFDDIAGHQTSQAIEDAGPRSCRVYVAEDHRRPELPRRR